uniref:Uncharacterized protein n=1 Tax=Solanum lycopersicum TaxID=4081 RepID=K4BZS0_SOLLC
MESLSSTTPVTPFSVTAIPGSSFPFFGLPPPVSIDSPTLPNFSSVATLGSPNVTNLVIIKLGSVQDYLTWRTQFTLYYFPQAYRDFIDHILLGLQKKYETLVGIITHSPGHLSLEELHRKLLLHEQRLQRFKELDSPIMHQAFAAHSVSTPTQDSGSQFDCGRGRGQSSSRSRGRGGKGRDFGGRG